MRLHQLAAAPILKMHIIFVLKVIAQHSTDFLLACFICCVIEDPVLIKRWALNDPGTDNQRQNCKHIFQRVIECWLLGKYPAVKTRTFNYFKHIPPSLHSYFLKSSIFPTFHTHKSDVRILRSWSEEFYCLHMGSLRAAESFSSPFVFSSFLKVIMPSDVNSQTSNMR